MLKSLTKIPRELDNSNIDKALTDYEVLLNQIPCSIQSDSILNFLTEIKREKLNLGPYPSVTLFEAANRIMTDLIILYGVKKLLSGAIKNIKFDKYIVELGNENNNKNDISAINGNDELIGEVFNVAKSFFQTKKSTALKKMRKGKKEKTKILLIYNSDAVSDTYKPKSQENEFHLKIALK